MKIVINKSNNVVMDSFPDTATLTMTANYIVTPDYNIGYLNANTGEIIEGVTLPSGFENKKWTYIDGTFTQAGDFFTAEEITSRKDDLRKEVAAKKDKLRDSGTTINGVFIHTDTQARSLLLGEKMAGTGDVNFYSREGVLINMTRAEFDAFYAEFHSYLKAVEENAATLIAQIDAATTMAEIVAIDLDSGWPE